MRVRVARRNVRLVQLSCDVQHLRGDRAALPELAEEVLRGSFPEGCVVSVTVKDGPLVFEGTTKPAEAKTPTSTPVA